MNKSKLRKETRVGVANAVAAMAVILGIGLAWFGFQILRKPYVMREGTSPWVVTILFFFSLLCGLWACRVFTKNREPGESASDSIFIWSPEISFTSNLWNFSQQLRWGGKYARLFFPKLIQRYGRSDYYTAAQILKTIQDERFSKGLAEIPMAMFISLADFELAFPVPVLGNYEKIRRCLASKYFHRRPYYSNPGNFFTAKDTYKNWDTGFTPDHNDLKWSEGYRE